MIKRFTFFCFVVFAFLLDIGSSFFWVKRFNSDMLSMFLSANSQASVVRVLIFLIFWLVLALYFNIYLLKRADRFLRICLRSWGHLMVFFITLQLLAVVLMSRVPLIEDLTVLFVVVFTQLTYRFVFFISIRALRAKKSAFKNSAMLLGEGPLYSELNSFLNNNPKIGYRTYNVEHSAVTSVSIKELQEQKIKALFVSQENVNKQKYKQVLEQAALLQIPIFIFADHDTVFKSNQVDYFGYIPIFKAQFSPLLQGINRHIKRTFDIVFSSLVIVFILSWMYPLVGMLIKLNSNGPILFVQNRNGLSNKLFKCYKFRSMTINSDNSQTKKEDTRVTRIGRIIRRTSIDEFPQFFNVLIGDMSVVGPRPHMEIHNKNYEKHISSFQLRHTVKPGITGMAQMRGFRGEIKENLDIINRIKYDIFYIRNWSFALDIKIIIRTVFNIFRGEEKAY